MNTKTNDVRPTLAQVAQELSTLTGQPWAASSLRQPWKTQGRSIHFDQGREENEAKRHGYLLGPGEQIICVYYHEEWHGKKPHYHIDGSWPYDSKNQAHTPSRYREEIKGLTLDINVSAEKEPKRIASDIYRRLLPGYAVALASCLASRDQANDYERQKVEGYALLAGILGLPEPGKQWNGHERGLDVGPLYLRPQGENFHHERSVTFTRLQALTLARWFSGQIEEELKTIAGGLEELPGLAAGYGKRLRGVAAGFCVEKSE